MSRTDYVWYASYGSNINKDRFLCYIEGGAPEGTDIPQRGCRDQSLPKDEKPYTIHHQLYFSKESDRWQGGGVCFIGLSENPVNPTYSNMYLITREQFLDVVSQENGVEDFDMDLDEVVQQGSHIFRRAWYGNILYIGEADGYPVFTFTSTEDFDPTTVRKPSEAYLGTIILGLKREVGLSTPEIIDYLKEIPGVQGQISEQTLQDIVAKIKI